MMKKYRCIMLLLAAPGESRPASRTMKDRGLLETVQRTLRGTCGVATVLHQGLPGPAASSHLVRVIRRLLVPVSRFISSLRLGCDCLD